MKKLSIIEKINLAGYLTGEQKKTLINFLKPFSDDEIQRLISQPSKGTAVTGKGSEETEKMLKSIIEIVRTKVEEFRLNKTRQKLSA